MKTLSSEYLEYIASDEWRIRRALKLLLAGGLSGRVQCEICCGIFSPRKVDVHHVTYERLKRESMDDLKIVCRHCHDLIREIDELSSGGRVDEVSESLMSRLALIDDRLTGTPETHEVTVRSADYEGLEAGLDMLKEVIQRKRRELGIAP